MINPWTCIVWLFKGLSIYITSSLSRHLPAKRRTRSYQIHMKKKKQKKTKNKKTKTNKDGFSLSYVIAC